MLTWSLSNLGSPLQFLTIMDTIWDVFTNRCRTSIAGRSHLPRLKWTVMWSNSVGKSNFKHKLSKQAEFFEGFSGRGFNVPWACLHYDSYVGKEIEYLETALRFYLSTRSVVVKCSPGRSQIWGPRFESRPTRTQFEMAVPMGVARALLAGHVYHCWNGRSCDQIQ